MLKTQCVVLITFWIIKPLFKAETRYTLNCNTFTCCRNSHILNWLWRNNVRKVPVVHFWKEIWHCVYPPVGWIEHHFLLQLCYCLSTVKTFIFGGKILPRKLSKRKHWQDDPCFSLAWFMCLVKSSMMRMLESFFTEVSGQRQEWSQNTELWKQ